MIEPRQVTATYRANDVPADGDATASLTAQWLRRDGVQATSFSRTRREATFKVALTPRLPALRTARASPRFTFNLTVARLPGPSARTRTASRYVLWPAVAVSVTVRFAQP